MQDELAKWRSDLADIMSSISNARHAVKETEEELTDLFDEVEGESKAPDFLDELEATVNELREVRERLSERERELVAELKTHPQEALTMNDFFAEHFPTDQYW